MKIFDITTAAVLSVIGIVLILVMVVEGMIRGYED